MPAKPLNEHERQAVRAWRERVMMAVPADHEWSRLMVHLVEELAAETESVLHAPPSACTAEDRTYNAGRMSFAVDLLARIEQWHRSAAKAAKETATEP